MAKRKRSKATEAKKREQQFELQKQLLFGNLLENDLKAWIFIKNVSLALLPFSLCPVPRPAFASLPSRSSHTKAELT